MSSYRFIVFGLFFISIISALCFLGVNIFLNHVLIVDFSTVCCGSFDVVTLFKIFLFLSKMR